MTYVSLNSTYVEEVLRRLLKSLGQAPGGRHSKLRAKSSQSNFWEKLSQLSRVDFYLPMGSKSLWFQYRDRFPELFNSYGKKCAAKNEVIQMSHFCP